MAWCRAIQVALPALDTGSMAVFLDDRVEDRPHVVTKAAETMVTATMRYEGPRWRPRRNVCMAFLKRDFYKSRRKGLCHVSEKMYFWDDLVSSMCVYAGERAKPCPCRARDEVHRSWMATVCHVSNNLDCVLELLRGRMDVLARKFHET